MGFSCLLLLAVDQYASLFYWVVADLYFEAHTINNHSLEKCVHQRNHRVLAMHPNGIFVDSIRSVCALVA